MGGGGGGGGNLIKETNMFYSGNACHNLYSVMILSSFQSFPTLFLPMFACPRYLNFSSQNIKTTGAPHREFKTVSYSYTLQCSLKSTSSVHKLCALN